MNKHEIETKVLAVLTTVLKCDAHLDSCRKNHSQWDSLKHIEIIFSIEDELNIRFPEDALPKLDSVKRIVDSAAVLLYET